MEDCDESPPANHFGYEKMRRAPNIYSRDEIDGLIAAATKLPSSDSLLPKTYAAPISLLVATGLRIVDAGLKEAPPHFWWSVMASAGAGFHGRIEWQNTPSQKEGA